MKQKPSTTEAAQVKKAARRATFKLSLQQQMTLYLLKILGN